MKKMVSFISALTMCAVMVAPVVSSAATIDISSESKSADVTLSKTVSSSYTVTIPDDMENIDTDSELTVSAADVIINKGQTLNVSVSSLNGWTLDGDGGSFTYSLTPTDVSDGVALENGDNVLMVASGTTSASKTFTAAVTGNVTMAGTYSDTLTFTVSVNTSAADS